MLSTWRYLKQSAPTHSVQPGTVEVWCDVACDPQELLSLLHHPRHEPAGEILQPGRNTVSRQSFSGIDCCVKDYGLRHIQPWIYRWRHQKRSERC